MHAYNLSTCELAGGSEIYDHLKLHSEFKASLKYTRLYLKKKIPEEVGIVFQTMGSAQFTEVV